MTSGPRTLSGRPDRLLAARVDIPPLAYERAEGSWIYSVDGGRTLDACSGLICVNIGHAHPAIINALTQQARTCAFASPGLLRGSLQEEYASRLARALQRPDDTVLLTTSGTAGIEAAISLAKAAQRARGEGGRHRILTSSLGYHGNSALTLGLSGHRRRRPHPDDALGLAPAFDPPFPGQHRGCRHATCEADCVDAVVRAIDTAGADTVAAVLFEPISGSSGGAYRPPDGYLAALSDACRSRGILVIHDEVLTGLGRTGLPLAAHHAPGATADLVVLSKGLGCGYLSIAAVLLDPGVAADVLAPGGLTPIMGTMSATPLQAAVGLAVLDVLDDIGALERAHVADAGLAEVLSSVTAGAPTVRDLRGCGFFFGIELEDGTLVDVLGAARRRGLLLYPFRGFRPDASGEGVIVAPPLNVRADEVEFLADALRATFEDVSR